MNPIKRLTQFLFGKPVHNPARPSRSELHRDLEAAKQENREAAQRTVSGGKTLKELMKEDLPAVVPAAVVPAEDRRKNGSLFEYHGIERRKHNAT